MLDTAKIGRGSHVLDVAAGAGEPALTAAERVGPMGSVLATDISSSILTFAAHDAAARGLTMLAGLWDTDQNAVSDEIAETLKQYETDSGFVGSCEMLVAAGTK
jgi:cyclopropane fatty-acyl-phospholipid synthase-like methyltransferase